MASSKTIPRLYSREETAEILGIRPSTLAAWACRDTVVLPQVKIGGRVHYLERDIVDLIESRRQGVAK
jgi:hypothetical protein